MRCFTSLGFSLCVVFLDGGGAESLSEVERRVARLGGSRPLKGSSRRRGRERSPESSLRDESVQVALGLWAPARVEVIQRSAAGCREACLIRPHECDYVLCDVIVQEALIDCSVGEGLL